MGILKWSMHKNGARELVNVEREPPSVALMGVLLSDAVAVVAGVDRDYSMGLLVREPGVSDMTVIASVRRHEQKPDFYKLSLDPEEALILRGLAQLLINTYDGRDTRRARSKGHRSLTGQSAARLYTAISSRVDVIVAMLGAQEERLHSGEGDRTGLDEWGVGPPENGLVDGKEVKVW
jgi:hypothetical protein